MDAPVEYRTKNKLGNAAQLTVAAGRAVSYTSGRLYEVTRIKDLVEKIKPKSLEDKIE